jgi:hypothetical protein
MSTSRNNASFATGKRRRPALRSHSAMRIRTEAKRCNNDADTALAAAKQSAVADSGAICSTVADIARAQGGHAPCRSRGGVNTPLLRGAAHARPPLTARHPRRTGSPPITGDDGMSALSCIQPGNVADAEGVLPIV